MPMPLHLLGDTYPNEYQEPLFVFLRSNCIVPARSKALADLAETAYRIEDFEKCRTAAEEILKLAASGFCEPDEFHEAHQLIGLLHLQNDDRSRACSSLLESAALQATPVLSSFGPKFYLAKKLLELNERTAVLKYLEACSIFWESGQTALTYWWLAIKLGRKPKLDKQGPVELCFPDWLNGLAGGLMSLIRTMRR